MSGRPPVMHDVARLAGVSHQTVSRVINGAEGVRPQTRERVLVAMRQLEYRPNLLARALVTGRSRTFGVITSASALYGPSATLIGVERAAVDAGYFVSEASLVSPDVAGLRQAAERLMLQAVEGLIVIAPSPLGASGPIDLPRAVPAVVIEATDGIGVPSARVDQYRGGRDATECLLRAGHATVHHLAGPAEWQEARNRLHGWRDALLAAGARGTEPAYGDWSPRSGYEAGARLLADGSVTAVFVANDQMALGFMRLLGERGLTVPDDISLVGFDDIPEAEFFSPPLTTIRQDFAELGRQSVRMLVEQIDQRAKPRSSLVPTRLITRASVAPPSAAAAP